MPELMHSYAGSANLPAQPSQLPISSIVRALCQAANSGPDLLYEVILKLSLRVEATAPMYGLSLWTLDEGDGTRLAWSEGLLEDELTAGETLRFRNPHHWLRLALNQGKGFLCSFSTDGPEARFSWCCALRKMCPAPIGSTSQRSPGDNGSHSSGPFARFGWQDPASGKTCR